jgi:hypothetical protein
VYPEKKSADPSVKKRLPLDQSVQRLLSDTAIRRRVSPYSEGVSLDMANHGYGPGLVSYNAGSTGTEQHVDCAALDTSQLPEDTTPISVNEASEEQH